MTKIEWTDKTWNPVVGCSVASPGCDNCYAAGVASRQMQPAHEGLTVGRQWNGEVRLLTERLEEPLRWRKPQRVFVCSMSDLFHPKVPTSFVVDVFARMALARRHTFQVLTKRPHRMGALITSPEFVAAVAEEATEIIGRTAPYDRWTIETYGWTPSPDGHGSNLWSPPWPLPNVWLGVSIENDRYLWRADALRDEPAAVRFLSIEPLLGPIGYLDLRGIDWVIVGGESGPGARPMHPAWPRRIRDICTNAGVAFFFKQWGEWAPGGEPPTSGRYVDELTGETYAADSAFRPRALMTKLGKSSSGRVLDGRTWDEYPTNQPRGVTTCS